MIGNQTKWYKDMASKINTTLYEINELKFDKPVFAGVDKYGCRWKSRYNKYDKVWQFGFETEIYQNPFVSKDNEVGVLKFTCS